MNGLDHINGQSNVDCQIIWWTIGQPSHEGDAQCLNSEDDNFSWRAISPHRLTEMGGIRIWRSDPVIWHHVASRFSGKPPSPLPNGHGSSSDGRSVSRSMKDGRSDDRELVISLTHGKTKDTVGSRCNRWWELKQRDSRVSADNGAWSHYQGFIMFKPQPSGAKETRAHARFYNK